MPYDLFVCERPAPPAGELDDSTVQWEYFGTYPQLWLAQARVARHGQQHPRLKRWKLFSVRNVRAGSGKLHSAGVYTRKEA